MTDNKQPIGIWTLTNTHAVECLEINHDINDTATVKTPDGRIETFTIQYGENEESGEQTGYINLMEGEPDEKEGTVLYFDECIRV